MPNGLPEGYGWISLLATPLTVATGMVMLWGPELSRDLRLLTSHDAGRLLLGLLVLSLVGSVLWGVTRVQRLAADSRAVREPHRASTTLPQDYPRSDQPAPPFELVDQRGRRISNSDLVGHRTVLVFAFAHCQTICPGLVNTVTTAAARSRGPRPKLVIVTADPWRDRPSSLPMMAQRWNLNPDDHVLSGEVEQVVEVAEAFQVPLERNLRNGDVTHPGLAFVLDREGRLAYRFNDPSVEWLVEALGRLP